MKRYIYRAVIKENVNFNIIEYFIMNSDKIKKFVDEEILMTVSAYSLYKHLIVYYECMEGEMRPSEIFPGLDIYLETWPDKPEEKYWVRMMDVFHVTEPAGNENWRRVLPVEKRIGRLGRLKPEMVSSYIFYHFQLQEEQYLKENKYMIIGLNDNLLFLYEEIPNAVADFQYEGMLKTKNSPASDWENLMNPHFIPWENVPAPDNKLLECETLIEF